ncbi:MAG: amidohydrolase family protein [Gammaproteobacteria bacterium]|jgi:imidazolonepropionase-like amidohydrolase|nr:amidohydrolase family protein [Gammaproteobacteria bacterium]
MNICSGAWLTLIFASLASLYSPTAAADETEATNQILIHNVSVWDGTSDRSIAGQSVLIEGKLIKSIGADLSPGTATIVIDGRGQVLIPGIIEAHTHLALPVSPREIEAEDQGYLSALSVKAAEGVLMRGWTTVRDIGGPSQGLAKAIDEGIVVGPRVYTSAMFISQTSGHGDMRGLNDPHPNMGGSADAVSRRYNLIADGPAEVSRAVRESLRHGATAIKVMAGGGISSEYDPIDTTQYSVAELRAAVEAAEQWNTYVAVHAYTDAAVRNALEAGVKVIEHGHLLSEDTLKLLKAKGAFLSSQSFGWARRAVRAQYLSQGQQRGRPTPKARRAQSGIRSKVEIVTAGTDNLMLTARKLGIPVAFGTDAFGSLRAYEAAVHEFGYRLKWFTSLEILKQATSHNAKLLALTGPRNPYQDGPLGVIEEGAYADLLIVAGNPLEDVTVLEDFETNIQLIMKDGVVYKNTLE